MTFVARLGDRELFPTLEAMIYLNHAAISPPSVAIRKVVKEVVADYERRGVVAFQTWHDQRQRLRAKLARLVGAEARDIALTASTTRGIVDVALCIPWARADRVVCFEGEFPANVTPWQRAAELFGLGLAMVPLAPFAESDEAGLARLEAELARGGVRVVAVSAVQFQTGLRMPLGAISAACRRHGAQLFVDAVQAVGVVPIDVAATPIDYLACGSHKWLMGLEGAGFVYVAAPRAQELVPRVAGWLSHEEGLGFLFEGPGQLRYDRPIRRTPDFLEVGNYNTLGLAALEASVDLLLDLGVPAIHAHVNAWADLVEPGLVERGFESLRSPEPGRRGGALGVRPPAGIDVVALHARLGARGVSCSIPDGVLRLAPHWPNNLDESEQVLSTLDLCLTELRGAP